VRWLADECFDNDIIRGLCRRLPAFDIVRAQDIGEISGGDDEILLDWATRQQRIVLTHDLATMVPAILRQQQRAIRCAPVVLVPDSIATGAVIEDILLLDLCSEAADWTSGILYLPLR
jgi:hypothetical protein